MSKPEKNVQSRCVILHDSDDFQYAILKLVDNLVKQNTCTRNLCYSACLVCKSLNHAVEKHSTQKFRNCKQNNQICVRFVVFYIWLKMCNVGKQNTITLSLEHRISEALFHPGGWLVLQKTFSLIRSYKQKCNLIGYETIDL